MLSMSEIVKILVNPFVVISSFNFDFLFIPIASISNSSTWPSLSKGINKLSTILFYFIARSFWLSFKLLNFTLIRWCAISCLIAWFELNRKEIFKSFSSKILLQTNLSTQGSFIIYKFGFSLGTGYSIRSLF